MGSEELTILDLEARIESLTRENIALKAKYETAKKNWARMLADTRKEKAKWKEKLSS